MKRFGFKITGFLLAGILVLSFQNCSELTLKDSVIYAASASECAQVLDRQYLPALASSDQIVYWSNSANPIHKDPFFAQSWSYVVVVSPTTSGDILSVNTGNSQEEGRLSITAGKIRLTHFYDGNNYSYIESNLPSGSGSNMVIGATFGSASQDMSLLINGLYQNSIVQKVGTPLDFSYIQKFVVVADSVVDVIIYNQAQTQAQVNVMSRYLAAQDSVNNVVCDPSLMAGDPSNGTIDPLFVAAKAIIDGKCVSCHNSSNNGDLTNFTLTKAISQGWIEAANPQGSKLYYRLKGSSGNLGPKTMPADGSISADEVQAISDWISSVK
ncbi:MAG TPA: c-type cytochrome [Bdellovibrio sp.]|nr:c-type cytochrome [Bdellovibrio sp.]